MSKSVVARLRDRLNRYTPREWSAPFTPVEDAALAALLDIVEAVAAKEPLWLNDELDAGGCIYCDGAAWNNSGIDVYGPECTEENKPPHAPNCPYIRARELCGMERSGAE